MTVTRTIYVTDAPRHSDRGGPVTQEISCKTAETMAHTYLRQQWKYRNSRSCLELYGLLMYTNISSQLPAPPGSGL
jgi:hypothetical protein